MYIYNPQNATFDQLDATLTDERRRVADRLVERFEDAFDKGNAHYSLLISPRGGGKTHLLAYVRKKLKTLNDERMLVPLSEEERGISSMLGFLIQCLKVQNSAPKNYRQQIQKAAETLETAKQLFDDSCQQQATLLVVENLNVIFAGMSIDELHGLRHFFQQRPWLSILASSITLFDDSKRKDHPFYGFFLIHSVNSLNVESAARYLVLLAKDRRDQKLAEVLETAEGKSRVAAIHALTGGNHRLLKLLSGFLTAEALEELVQPFINLIDRELTPYYQQRLDRLTPQQNEILNAIAEKSA